MISEPYRPMTFKLFLEFIRLPTKSASAVPWVMGVLFSWYYFHTVNWLSAGLYLIAQIAVAFFVTGFNNVQDYRLAVDKQYRDTYNIIGREHLSPQHAYHLMWGTLALACGLGLILVWRTNLLLLLMGAVAIAISILYTAGPVPFSRFPIGEGLSGVVEGFGVFFLTVYMSVAPSDLMGLMVTWPQFALVGNLKNCLILGLVGLPNVILVANIMLANNIGDVPQDIKNHRYTLPYYLGHDRAMQLYRVLVFASYVPVLLSVVLRLLPIYQLLTLLALPQLIKNVRLFNQTQVREATFYTAPQNLMLFQGLQMIGLILGLVFGG
ncbi:UbiA family prenyltransferase [Lactiplantibacillus daowaiensis]|uniref:UbiA family prenyltransferase n=1 Tax=Lactiplantibacillus daowaiensis TaxID=2559918 RepID=A0ABW1S0C0_9LACO|nr:UbiA family prenyltransferase [Lactiplantibacillus daowaiensis]